jgi:hypothetical protein
LREINATNSTTSNYKFDDYKHILNGYGRVIFYQVHQNQTLENGSTIYDPHADNSNYIYSVTEGYLENGLASKEPYYGRIYRNE